METGLVDGIDEHYIGEAKVSNRGLNIQPRWPSRLSWK
jgi:hypothetical protein